MRRLLGNFYIQVAAGYAVFGGVLAARVILFPENARVLLSPMYGWWEPWISWWALPAAAVLGGAVYLAWRGRERVRAWLLFPISLAAAVAVNLMPGGWVTFPFRSLFIFVRDAGWLYQNDNVFRNYVALTAHSNQHCRVRPGMTYWLLGIADRLARGNEIVVELLLLAAAAGAVLAAYALARTLLDKRESWFAATLFAFAPSFLIYGAGPDGFYALLGLATFALALRSFLKPAGWPYALGAGFVFAFALTSAYTLAPVFAFLGVIALAVSLTRTPRARPWVNLGLVVVSAFAFLAAFQIVTGYDHIAAFKRAYWTAQALAPGGDNVFKMAARLAGGGGLNLPKAGERPYLVWVFANLFAFFAMTGVPLAVLYGREALAVVRDRARRMTTYGAVALAFLGAFLAYNFSGLILGETERTWLFLVGGFAFPAAVALVRFAKTAGRRAYGWALALGAFQAGLYHILIGTPF